MNEYNTIFYETVDGKIPAKEFLRETLNKAFPARKSRPLAAFHCDFLRILPEALRKN